MCQKSNIKGLTSGPHNIAFRLYMPEAFELDSLYSLRQARLPYEHFPISMQLPIVKIPRLSAMLLVNLGISTEGKAETFRYKVGVESLTYTNGYHFIQISSTIRTILGYLKGQQIGYFYPQAFRFDKEDGWTMDTVTTWLSHRFKLEEI